MAEYVVDLQVRDARTGAVVSRFTTGLRMGAHDAWFRGVRSLMRHLPCPQSIQVRKTVQVRAMAQIDPEGPLWRHRVLSAGHSWPFESHRVRHFARPIQNFRTFVIMVTFWRDQTASGSTSFRALKLHRERDKQWQS